MVNNNMTYQQSLVWNRLNDGLRAVEEANDRLDSFAAKIILTSTVMVALFTYINTFCGNDLNGTPHDIVSIVLCASVVLMIQSSRNLLWRRQASIPISSDTGVLYREYISKTEDVAFNNALIDTAKALEDAVCSNKAKSRELWILFFFVRIQIFAILFGSAFRLAATSQGGT